MEGGSVNRCEVVLEWKSRFVTQKTGCWIGALSDALVTGKDKI